MVHKVNLVIIAVSVGLGVGILIATLIFFGIWWYKRRTHLQRSPHDSLSSALPTDKNSVISIESFSNSVTVKLPTYPAKTSPTSKLYNKGKERLPSVSGLLKYSYKDVQKATKNFTTTLGQGSFGPVYKAVMPAGETVAAKALASDSKQGEKEFQTEVSLLGRLHHINLVNLVGYCVDKSRRMLIYEYMRNGSLANFLYNEEKPILKWEERLQIALDISHGIEYLHDGAVPPVIHRDLKSANILLDHLMRAKVADFGLSKEEVYDDRNSCVKAIHPHQNLTEYVNLAAMSSDGVDEILDKKTGRRVRY